MDLLSKTHNVDVIIMAIHITVRGILCIHIFMVTHDYNYNTYVDIQMHQSTTSPKWMNNYVARVKNVST